jgi:hypothetical protein
MVLLGLLVLFFVFAFRYTVVDRYAFFIPFYCVVSILIGLGAYLVQKRTGVKALVYVVLGLAFLPVGVYAVVPKVAKQAGFGIGTKRAIAHRDDYRYFLQPWKTGYKEAWEFAEEALDGVEENSIIYADTTTVYPLLYGQEVQGKRADVKVVSVHHSSAGAPVLDEETVAGLMKSSGVYVVSAVRGYCPRFLLDNYDFVESGVLQKVVERK